MARIVRLTERDLNRLVKRVIKEQAENNDESIVELNSRMILLKGATSNVIQKVMSQLTDEIKYIAFLDCEEADFSNVDVCNNFPKLLFVNVKGTPNNFEETQEDCYELFGEGGYFFLK
jgi:hypothetical protein